MLISALIGIHIFWLRDKLSNLQKVCQSHLFFRFEDFIQHILLNNRLDKNPKKITCVTSPSFAGSKFFIFGNRKIRKNHFENNCKLCVFL